VKTVVDARLREEARRYAFRYACEDCAHFSPSPRHPCSLAYPASPRQGALDGPIVEFCKSFEVA
jgi:hypothetical protein